MYAAETASISISRVEAELTKLLQDRFAATISRASELLDKELNVHKFHAIIGCRNNDFVDAVRTQFSDPDDFWRRWLRGFRLRFTESYAKEIEKNGRVKNDRSVFRLKRLLDDDDVLEYTRLFLVRNFYRNLKARTRSKPQESLWEIWFGENRGPWGLLITPTRRLGAWTNDKSEMRHARYEYWTIGHVLSEGLAAPNDEKTFSFSSVEQVTQFYSMVLARASRSKHEKEISNLYLKYLEDSDQVLDEPFLIPEVRYAGLDEKHKYRLDYTVLNPHTMQFVGFELSPHSSHGSVTGMKSKTQKRVNQELAEQWEHEMDKRNDYFQTFGIATITFTDAHLSDPHGVFSTIQTYLAARAEQEFSAAEEIAKLRAI